MASPTFKVKTIKIPNVDLDSNIEELEEDIEDVINKKYDNGYALYSIAGGDCFVLLVFKKSE